MILGMAGPSSGSLVFPLKHILTSPAGSQPVPRYRQVAEAQREEEPGLAPGLELFFHKQLLHFYRQLQEYRATVIFLKQIKK